MKGYLVLSTGDVFEGEWFGSVQDCTGEVVFNTGMTGYQEVLSDPSYAGQMITFTYPLIGNYGINERDFESIKPACRALLVGDLCQNPSHYESDYTLSEVAERYGIGGLSGIDTRAVTHIVRTHGEVYGLLTTDQEKVASFIPQPVRDVVPGVSVTSVQEYGREAQGPHIVLIDYGYKKSILQSLLDGGCRVTVVPYNVTHNQVHAIRPDGVFLSNGPGDPKEITPYLGELKKIVESYPTMGICLGHQLISLIYGCDTERLPYGHRGSNHPVKDLRTGKVYMTSQNHGYVVKEDSLSKTPLLLTFSNVNDKSVEGVRHKELPIWSVQFHPEAHAGPQDTEHLFTEFIQQCQVTGEKSYA
ncbi:carbamoyl phosphate synthase small subunit [Aneurinibacillus aneurinilyticus]|jgi:carbamoyl-phosphate synthase small subunit|uniref:carbamoyl phosphate synthase small subunit n=1 Tax=Aneurinibacillus aneurinilyticus TaxID=1391 RepID=UPI0023F7524A|nr:carbamoyl phosphate synthase small subunit [Aneurinibacillus aneurinilyticus]MCI1693938.1 carbamoyl phosphate synthase small subunit [Aneurinibacillus aneurinilyticus]